MPEYIEREAVFELAKELKNSFGGSVHCKR